MGRRSQGKCSQEVEMQVSIANLTEALSIENAANS